MQKPKASLLLHPLFVLSLVVLLLNDRYWKYEYHNWLTGKLSDVAGLVVLPVFVRFLFPKISPTVILLFCAAFFCWWKSPLSETVIGFFNQSLHLPVQRVIDYSDLLALAVLPFSACLQPASFSFHATAISSLKWILGTATVFSLCATSMPYRSLFQAHPDTNEVYFHESFTQKRKADNILQTLEQKGITFRMDSVMFYPVLNQRDLYYRKPTATDSVYVWRQISQASDSTLFIRREGSPYYIIPSYRATTGNRSTDLRNIRFILSENKKGTKTSVVVEMFESPGLRGYMDNQTRNHYKNIFRELFSNQ